MGHHRVEDGIVEVQRDGILIEHAAKLVPAPIDRRDRRRAAVHRDVRRLFPADRWRIRQDQRGEGDRVVVLTLVAAQRGVGRICPRRDLEAERVGVEQVLPDDDAAARRACTVPSRRSSLTS